MGANQNQYITTVANCFLRDVDSDIIVMKSKTLINSNVAFNVEETEIRGGEFHRLLYTYNYGRTGEVTLEDARYEPALIALNCGQSIKTEASNVYVFEEEVTLDGGGSGTISEKTPVAGTNAYVQTSNGTMVTKSFSGSTFSMGSTFAGQKVYVTYQYSDTLEVITIDGDSFPKTYELVMEVKVWDKDGLKEKVQWIFPAFKPSGNFEMPLASDSPTTTSMTGKVLDNDGIYGYKKVIPVSGSVTYTAIAADTGEVELGNGDSYILTVYALRGGVYAPTTLNNTDCNFTSGSDSIATVDENGKIEYAGNGTTYITITHGETDLTDTVKVICESN